MGKEHFNLFALAARLPVCRRLHNGTGNVPCIRVDAARDLAIWRVRAAPWLQAAIFAIQRAGVIKDRCFLSDMGPWIGEVTPFLAQWLAFPTTVLVCIRLPNKVSYGKGIIPSLLSHTGTCGAIPLCLTSHPSMAALP